MLNVKGSHWYFESASATRQSAFSNAGQCRVPQSAEASMSDIYFKILSFSPLWRISMAPPPTLLHVVVARLAIRESLNILLDCKLRKYWESKIFKKDTPTLSTKIYSQSIGKLFKKIHFNWNWIWKQLSLNLTWNTNLTLNKLKTGREEEYFWQK